MFEKNIDLLKNSFISVDIDGTVATLSYDFTDSDEKESFYNKVNDSIASVYDFVYVSEVPESKEDGESWYIVEITLENIHMIDNETMKKLIDHLKEIGA